MRCHSPLSIKERSEFSESFAIAPMRRLHTVNRCNSQLIGGLSLLGCSPAWSISIEGEMRPAIPKDETEQ